jgi:hypothetical protein
LNDTQRRRLKDASADVDSLWGQLEAYAYQHGMRGGPKESVEHARKDAADFMSDHLQKARNLAPRESGYEKIPLNALGEFGQALHTITDMTSPVHEGFQIWYGPPYPTGITLYDAYQYKKWLGYVKWHHDHETKPVLESDPGRLATIKDTVRKAFADIFGDDCGRCHD